MTRQILFQIHWFLGITAGLVLAVMGVTGATMSFEDEIMRALSPGIVTVPVRAAAPLTPAQLLERARAQRNGLEVTLLTVESRPGDAARVGFGPAPGQRGRGESLYQDPYTGDLLGHARGERFFATVRRVHRWLALPGDGNGAGRIITGISALALVYFALSGLYLRWPRKPLDWRAWFVLDLRRSGRNLYRTLHAVIGGWMLAFYLLSGLTGMWWTFAWYRSGVNYVLTGQAAAAEGRAGQAQGDGPGAGHGGGRAHGRRGHHDADGATAGAAAAPSLDRAWAGFQHATADRFESVDIFQPGGPGPVRFRALLEGARHDRMTDEIRVDPADGRVLAVDRYADRPLGRTLASSMLTVHRGSFFGLPGRIVMATTSLSLPLFTVTGFLLYLARRKRKRALRGLGPLSDAAPAGEGLLVAYASQTGAAQRLARQTAAAFEAAGQPTRVLPLARLGAADLAAAARALFVVSTYADGEPPDEARGFARRAMAAPAGLAQLEYAVLALGDREYPDFCAFGRQLEGWLERSGARRLFARVELDGDDAEAQRQWERHIDALGASSQPADWQPEPFRPWRLAERRLLNPGSPGAPVFQVVLEPAGDAPAQWEPGDIAEILPRQDPARIAAYLAAARLDSYDEAGHAVLAAHLAGLELPAEPATAVDELPPLRQREYSIASIAASGRIELLVRQQPHADGRLGIGSGWLTAHAPLGGEIPLRIRPNPGFRPLEHGGPAILIGNGTGLAGLLAHLRHRAAAGLAPTWLLFGERSGAHDRLHAEELERHLASGALARLDLIFSRDAGGGYVQRLVEAHAEALRRWVGDGAAIFVCGSLQGMAPELDAALRRALGDAAVDHLAEQGRYRRDVY